MQRRWEINICVLRLRREELSEVWPQDRWELDSGDDGVWEDEEDDDDEEQWWRNSSMAYFSVGQALVESAGGKLCIDTLVSLSLLGLRSPGVQFRSQIYSYKSLDRSSSSSILLIRFFCHGCHGNHMLVDTVGCDLSPITSIAVCRIKDV